MKPTEQDKQLFRQYRNLGYNYKDIGAIFGCNASTVVYWLNHQDEKERGRQKAIRRHQDPKKYAIDLKRHAAYSKERRQRDPDFKAKGDRQSTEWQKKNRNRANENRRKSRARRRLLGLPVT